MMPSLSVDHGVPVAAQEERGPALSSPPKPSEPSRSLDEPLEAHRHLDEPPPESRPCGR
jgi:hypothetical protein